MKIFVTGGSGFLGKILLERLQTASHEVKALARSERSAKTVTAFGATAISGSLENISEWSNSLQGVDTIIHCAAPVEFWGKWDYFHKYITQATITLQQAAAEKGVNRFIYISSESVLQEKTDLLNIDETYPYPIAPNSYYGKAKMQAEQAILASNYQNLTSIILRPTFIWGKGVQALETMAEKVKNGQFMWIDHGKTIIEMVHIDNVVEAIFLSLSKGNDKQVYFVTDNNPLPAKEFLTNILATKNIAPSDKNMSSAMVKPLASLIEGVWKLFGIKSTPPLSKFELSFVNMARKYNISKIQKELNYRPIVSTEKGLELMKE